MVLFGWKASPFLLQTNCWVLMPNSSIFLIIKQGLPFPFPLSYCFNVKHTCVVHGHSLLMWATPLFKQGNETWNWVILSWLLTILFENKQSSKTSSLRDCCCKVRQTIKTFVSIFVFRSSTIAQVLVSFLNTLIAPTTHSQKSVYSD